jgi:hypothetical protein
MEERSRTGKNGKVTLQPRFHSIIHLALSTGGDGDLGAGLSRVGSLSLDGLDDVHSLDDLSEDDVLAVQPGGDNSGDEELGSVGVGSSVGRGQESGLGVLELEVLVRELVSVDGLSTGTVVAGEVSTLEHEVGDDTVESRGGVPETVHSGAELTEVAGSLGDYVVVELEDNASQGSIVLSDVEEDVGHVWSCSGSSKSTAEEVKRHWSKDVGRRRRNETCFDQEK